MKKQCIVIVLLFAGRLTFGQVPTSINYQGKLTDSGGDPLTGPHTLKFNIYDVVIGGTAIWGPQTYPGVVLTADGQFNLILGPTDTNATPRQITDAFAGQPRFLGITVDANPEITPRQGILSVPYAMQTLIRAGSITNSMLADGSVGTNKIADLAVVTNKIADGAVTASKLASVTTILSGFDDSALPAGSTGKVVELIARTNKLSLSYDIVGQEYTKRRGVYLGGGKIQAAGSGPVAQTLTSGQMYYLSDNKATAGTLITYPAPPAIATRANATLAGLALNASTLQWDLRGVTLNDNLVYNVVDLGVLPGYTGSFALGLNDSGVVVGFCDTNNDYPHLGFKRDAIGGMQSLGLLAGSASSRGDDINETGQILGLGVGVNRAFFWNSGNKENLDLLPGASAGDECQPGSITWDGAKAWITGYGSLSSNTVHHMYLWDSVNQTLQDKHGGSYTNSEGYGINKALAVVGWRNNAGGPSIGFYWKSGAYTDIPPLGGSASNALNINDLDEVVGYASITGDSATHAFIWDKTSGTADLGTLSGQTSTPHAINNSSQIVGDAPNSLGEMRAFITRKGQGLTDLNTLISPTSGWTLQSAQDINNSGQIVGYGTHSGSLKRAFLLDPIN